MDEIKVEKYELSDFNAFIEFCKLFNGKASDDENPSDLYEKKLLDFVNERKEYAYWVSWGIKLIEAVAIPLSKLSAAGELYDPDALAKTPTYSEDLRNFIYRYGTKKGGSRKFNDTRVQDLSPELFLKFFNIDYLKDLYYTCVAKNSTIDDVIDLRVTKAYLNHLDVKANEIKFLYRIEDKARLKHENFVKFALDFISFLGKNS